MNQGNENNGFPFVCLMENGHNILSNVIRAEPKDCLTKKYIKYSNFEKNIIHVRLYESTLLYTNMQNFSCIYQGCI